MPLVKPHAPVWQPGRAPAGCKVFYSMSEGAGLTTADLTGNGYKGSFVGSGGWSAGDYGRQAGNFRTAAGRIESRNRNQIWLTNYPCWYMVHWTNLIDTGGFQSFASFGTFNAEPGSHFAGCNSSNVWWFNWTDADTPVTVSYSVPNSAQFDGKPHTYGAIAYSLSEHRYFYDGRQVASSSGAIGTSTGFRDMIVGAAMPGAGGTIASGNAIAFAAGNGATPDMRALHNDWITGQFSAVRPRKVFSLYIPAPPIAATAGIAAATTIGQPAFSGTVTATAGKAAATTVGSPTATLAVTATAGIASGTVIGQPTATQILVCTAGIASTLVIGDPSATSRPLLRIGNLTTVAVADDADPFTGFTTVGLN